MPNNSQIDPQDVDFQQRYGQAEQPAVSAYLDHWFYMGNHVGKAQFDKWVALEAKGTCPFCHRTGLSARFGSRRKHISACKRNPKETK